MIHPHAKIKEYSDFYNFKVPLVTKDRWLSVEEIAEYLGVSKDTVYSWINKKSMPAHRIGRPWKFKADEVDQWVRSGGAADNNKQGR